MEETKQEALRVFESMQKLKEAHSALQSSGDFTVGFAFSRQSKESLYLTSGSGIVVYTIGLAVKMLPELVFCVGPGKNESAMKVADALTLASDLVTMLDEQAALSITKDFLESADSDTECSLLIGGPIRSRIYKETHGGKSAMALLERNLFKEKHLHTLSLLYKDRPYDVILMEHGQWVS